MSTDIQITTSDLMSVQDAATALRRPRMTIYRWIARRKLLAVKLGGTYYVLTSEVDRLKREGNSQGGEPMMGRG